MEQEKIDYGDIMSLGFAEDFYHDDIFFDQYGYEYSIITKNLTKKIYLDWDKRTRLCKLIRIDSPDNGTIKAELPIKNLNYLREVVDFFTA